MQRVLLTLIRTSLCHTVQSGENTFNGQEWPEVYRLAARQGVAAIAWDGVQRLINDGIIPPEKAPEKAVKLQWALSVERTEVQYRRQRKVIEQLAEIYGDAGIKMMILKGYGLSLYYPVPEHRACCDVDIWLFGQQQCADNLLRSKLGIHIDEDKHHHTVFHLGGVMVENHYDFLNIHAHLSNRDIERRLRAEAESPEAIELGGRTVYRPNANCHALFLLRHAAAHFAAVEIVLRHIIDWGLFVKHNHASIDWAWLRAVACEHNMERFLDAMNAISADICGIDIVLMPNTARRPDLERRILNDILAPEFSEKKPDKGALRIIWYKCRRWWANRWKHRLVYREGLLSAFLMQLRSHILKPKSITH